MKYIQYLKRGIKYILHGQPTQKVYAQITYLSPSDLLKGRTALITGGTSGIGYEIAKAFINAGAICVITGRDENKVQRTCEKINKEVSKKDHIFGLSWDVLMSKAMAVFLVSNMGRSIIGDMVFMTGGSGVVTYDDVHYSF